MKQYNNGPRKAMSYGGMPMRKPMMKGGKVKKMQAGGKAKKKMSPMMPATPMTAASQRTPMAMGGMSATQQQQNMQQNMMPMTSGQMNQMQTDMMQSPKLRMAPGGMLGDLNKDGQMSKYETARQNAIEANMKKQRKKKATV